ncbi:glucose 1-dehydrogenase [Paenibacillus sp. LS1]|uniref:SDR family NAD(P)-dependent oxidoreductase n=1 Tax=Paenibacillus sp. LS1 TaxID=2992120 RepID=UPI00222EDD75|nr:glucose 1-dehydrogenase [Paenibacillus sp. LS1]MCW3794440.1 glucose 1-dehydrogenase [Paenibacillus sp. LS1]
MLNLNFTEQAGLVTGAGSGIGRASAIAFAQAGAKVMVADINEKAGLETVQLIQAAGGVASFFKCNVAAEEDILGLVDATVSEFGKLNFAHNNAGITLPPAPIAESSSEDFDRLVKVNLYGIYYAIKHEIQAMLKTGGGAIVNTSSGFGLIGGQNQAIYSTTKFAITGMTRSVAMEYAKYDIRVNAICPGMTATPILSWLDSAPDQADFYKSSIPSGKLQTAEDQANAAVFLCSNLAKQITGVALAVDGGYVAGR